MIPDSDRTGTDYDPEVIDARQTRSSPVMNGVPDMAGAGDGQLEGVDVKTQLVGVGQKPDKVVLLEALRGVLVVDERARRRWVPEKQVWNKFFWKLIHPAWTLQKTLLG